MSDIAEVLRGLPYFEDLPEALLDRVCRRSEEMEVPAGTVIIEEGARSADMFIVVEGEIRVTKQGPDREVHLATRGPGTVVGEMALLDNAPRTASVTASSASRLIRVPADAFEALLEDSRVVRRMFRMVISRLRSIEETLRHEERMAALGRMAAQLMHELNNPAAAVARSTARAQEVYQALGDAAVRLAASGELTGRDLPVRQTPVESTPLQRSEQENEVARFLTEHQVDDPWELGPALVADGFARSVLEEAIEGLTPETTRDYLRWLGLRCLAAQLLAETRVAVGRISELVRVVKDYSFLDRAPIQELDLTQGIADTLILLKHKLTGIEVEVDADPGLPKVEGSGRDLNQVWTNLIDNAADAMGEQGKLTIRLRPEGEGVLVSIADTGGGIDPEIAERIFDPFFTTKEPGKGTGLGLHTVHTIVTRSGGRIGVESEEGGTRFEVWLPRQPVKGDETRSGT